ncbi:hypothetical protein [Spirosoma areae]
MMRTLTIVLLTLLGVALVGTLVWVAAKSKAENDRAKQSTLEQRIRDLYGDDVIID